MGGRVARIPPPGQPAANSQQSASGLNLNVRENLNKSQNIVMPSGISAYAPSQLLQSSSR